MWLVLTLQKDVKMNWREHIHSDSEILLGKPVIKGTRLAVELLIERLADGWTEQQLFDSYPRLTRDDLNAVFACVLDCMHDGLLYVKQKKSAY